LIGFCFSAALLLIPARGAGHEGAPHVAPAAASKPNVVFITIDTLRADHLGCYGYSRVETPNIDDLARAGVRFSHAFTPVPITLPAHTAIFTGSFPMATGMHDFSGNKVPANAMTLARVLHEHGYTTAAFIGAAVLDSRFGLNQGFETYFDHFNFSRLDETNLDLTERRGDLVADETLGWLKRNPGQPFFSGCTSTILIFLTRHPSPTLPVIGPISTTARSLSRMRSWGGWLRP